MKAEYSGLTIGIVFYNEVRLIIACLESIADQLRQMNQIETEWILINNAAGESDQQMLHIVNRWLQQHVENHRVIQNQKNNIAVARNLIATASTKKLVYMTDPDCSQNSNGLKELYSFFMTARSEHSRLAGVGGQNIPAGKNEFEDALIAIRRSLFGHFFSSQMIRAAEPVWVDHLPSCHILVDGDTFKTHLMNENLAYVGEDLEWGIRLNQLDFRFLHYPLSSVTHETAANMRSWTKKIFRYGRAQIKVFAINKSIIKGPRLAPLVLIFAAGFALIFFPKYFMIFSFTYAAFIYFISWKMARTEIKKIRPSLLWRLFISTQLSYACGQAFEFVRLLVSKTFFAVKAPINLPPTKNT